MNKKKRFLILIICLALFFLAAPILALYSQGYKLDLKNLRFVETGGFYIQTLNTPARVYIDGAFKRKTGIFQHATFIKNLIPDNYHIRLSQEGFFDWEKTLPVYSQTVTEARNIFLLKKDLSFGLLGKGIVDYLVSPDKTSLLFKKEEADNWLIEEISLDNQEKKEIIRQKEIEEITSDKEITLAKWDNQNKRILISYDGIRSTRYILIRDYETEPEIIILDNVPEGIKDINFNPSDSQTLLFLQGKTIMRLEEDKDTPSPLLNNVITYQVKAGEIIWLSNSGFIYRSDYLGEIKEIINRKPLDLKEDNNYQIHYYAPDIVFLSVNETLYYLLADGSFQEISQEVKGLVLSPDQTRLCFWKNSELWILDLKPEERTNYYGQEDISEPYKKVFLNRFSKKIGDSFWLTPYYLIFNIEDEIKISEIDRRERLNIYNLKDFAQPSIFFDYQNKTLIVLSRGNLFVFDSILE